MRSVDFLFTTLKHHRKRIALAVTMMLGVTLLGLMPPLILATVLDHVIGQQQYHWLAPLMILSLCLPWFNGIMGAIANYLITLVSQRLVFDLRLALYRSVQYMSIRQLQNTPTGTLLERLRGDVQQVQVLLSPAAINLMTQLVAALIAIGIMLAISVKLTAVVILGISLYVLNYQLLVKRIRRVQKRYRSKMDRLSARAQERLSGMIVVQAYNQQRYELRTFARRNFLTERIYHRFRTLHLIYNLTASVISWFSHGAVLLGGIWLVIHNEITYGQVLAVVAYAWGLLGPAVQLSELSNQFQQTQIALARINELMQSEADFTHPSNTQGQRLTPLVGHVTFENLQFHYEPDEPVIQNLNLSVKAGQTVAFVGQTGCGKSTMINLLYRYYDPQHGRVTIDGKDLRKLNTQWYRSQLAMVPQDPLLFDTTLAQNIAYGRPHASEQEILHAAQMAELGQVIAQLPQGIHTLLGEEGAKLSVGERQRLCIARAILKNPRILILDEATSSLDPQSETLIQIALDRVMTDRTTFIIAHRLSTIVCADLIVVLDQGKILEQGTHAHLMGQPDGHYRCLFETQMASGRLKETA